MELNTATIYAPVKGIGNQWSLTVCPEESNKVSKTGDQDDSVLMDSTVCPWMGEMLHVLTHKRTGSLWDFQYPAFAKEFTAAAKEVGVTAVPYQLRHSGPSWDALHSLRNESDIMARGRWRT
eukprot:4173063-Karenia_brevis.AAC.1